MPGLDKIPNKTIKMVLKELAVLLVNTVTVCLQKGELPKCLKITTTVVL